MFLSNDENIETIGQLVKVAKHYLELQSKYVKLDVTGKTVRLLTVAVTALLACVIILLALIFLSFAAVYALEPIVGVALAFCCVAGAHIVLLMVFLAFRKRWIERPLVKFFASILLE